MSGARSLGGHLQVRGLSVALGGQQILAGVDCDLAPGSITALLGPNGSGKTTLLRALLGLLPAQGRMELDGQDLRDLPVRERAQRLAYVPQRSQLEAAFTVRETVALGRFARGPDAAAVEAALADCDLLALAERNFPSLSGGERARVLIARALAAEAPVLLADEPGAHLDLRHQLELAELLRRLAAAGRSVLVVLHDLQRAVDCADRGLLLDHGRVRASGSMAEVLADPALEDTFGLRLRPGGALGVELRP